MHWDPDMIIPEGMRFNDGRPEPTNKPLLRKPRTSDPDEVPVCGVCYGTGRNLEHSMDECEYRQTTDSGETYQELETMETDALGEEEVDGATLKKW